MTPFHTGPTQLNYNISSFFCTYRWSCVIRPLLHFWCPTLGCSIWTFSMNCGVQPSCSANYMLSQSMKMWLQASKHAALCPSTPRRSVYSETSASRLRFGTGIGKRIACSVFSVSDCCLFQHLSFVSWTADKAWSCVQLCPSGCGWVPRSGLLLPKAQLWEELHLLSGDDSGLKVPGPH